MITHFAFYSRDLTKQEKTAAMCFFHIIVENRYDQAELEPKKLETADSSSLYVRTSTTWPTVQHTRGLGDSGNDVLQWQRGFRRVTVPCS